MCTYTTADKDTADDLRPGIDAGLRSPGEPEKTDDQDDSACYHRRETLFRDDFLGLGELRREDHLGLPRQSGACDEHSNENRNERQRCDTSLHLAV